jgi:3'-phosphoadenosine 5'-phosphosulfate sulfotransferase (PAPS reductase)/FAD synthetase
LAAGRAAKLAGRSSLSTIHGISRLLGETPAVVMFSTGKDSIVTLDLMIKHYKGPMKFVYLYFVKGLPMKEAILQHYEKRYGITIDRLPNSNHIRLKTGKKRTLVHIEADIRFKYDISYLAKGDRRDESFSRRGQLAHVEHGIDEKHKNLYPVIDFSKNDIYSYVKLHKLPLPIEYNSGKERDFYVPSATDLCLLKYNYPNDYQVIIKEFPQLEAVVWAQEHK